MATKLTTTLAEEVSAAFSPTGDFNVQCDATDPKVIVDVHAKLDAAAAYVIVASFNPALTPIARFVYFPFAKVGIRGSKAGTTVNVWSN